MVELLEKLNWGVLFLLLIGIVLVFGAIRLRVAFDGRYEIKAVDLALIVVPLLLFGIATGKIKDLNMFGVTADFSEMIYTEAKAEISNQVSKVKDARVADIVDTTTPDAKEGVGKIDSLVKKRTEVLSFQLGQVRYTGDGIERYVKALYNDRSYLRYIVLNNEDGTLFGMYPADELVPVLASAEDYRRIANALNTGESALLSEMRGFVSYDDAVTITTSKRDALQQMEEVDRGVLPVVNENKRFVGTVDRAKLTASLILAVTEQEKTKN